MRRWLPLAVALAAGSLALLAQPGASQQGAEHTAYPSWRSPPPDAERGEELAQVCLTCHIANSPQVDPPAPRLLHQRQSYLFFALRAYREGERESAVMAPFAAGLSDQDMRDVAAFLSGTMHDRPPRARTDLPIYQRSIAECTWCHGETGIGEFEAMPVLAGQEAAYLQLALAEYRSGTRSNPTMQAVAAELDPQDDAAFAEYYAAHEWLEHGQ